MAPWPHADDRPRLLVQPQVIPSRRGHVWLTGLVASPRVIDLGLVIELGDGSRDYRTPDSVSLPVIPQVHIASRAGEPLQGFHAGSEGMHKGAIFVHRFEWWNPTALPRECVLHIHQDEWAIAFSADFLIEP